MYRLATDKEALNNSRIQIFLISSPFVIFKIHNNFFVLNRVQCCSNAFLNLKYFGLYLRLKCVTWPPLCFGGNGNFEWSSPIWWCINIHLQDGTGLYIWSNCQRKEVHWVPSLPGSLCPPELASSRLHAHGRVVECADSRTAASHWLSADTGAGRSPRCWTRCSSW